MMTKIMAPSAAVTFNVTGSDRSHEINFSQMRLHAVLVGKLFCKIDNMNFSATKYGEHRLCISEHIWFEFTVTYCYTVILEMLDI